MSAMTERETMELAAKAAGIEIKEWSVPFGALSVCWIVDRQHPYGARPWAPLTDDGDALRLAVALRLDVTFNDMHVMSFPSDGSEGCAEPINVDDPMAAARLAITRAAAEIGRRMK